MGLFRKDPEKLSDADLAKQIAKAEKHEKRTQPSKGHKAAAAALTAVGAVGGAAVYGYREGDIADKGLVKGLYEATKDGFSKMGAKGTALLVAAAAALAIVGTVIQKKLVKGQHARAERRLEDLLAEQHKREEAKDVKLGRSARGEVVQFDNSDQPRSQVAADIIAAKETSAAQQQQQARGR